MKKILISMGLFMLVILNSVEAKTCPKKTVECGKTCCADKHHCIKNKCIRRYL